MLEMLVVMEFIGTQDDMIKMLAQTNCNEF